MSFKIDFYETEKGKSDIRKFINGLRAKASTNKSAQTQLTQVMNCINMLEENGTQLSTNIAKHIEGDIWELRPGRNRVFYFFYQNGTFVLLHHFMKKAQKTPRKEIEKAKIERADYIARHKAKEN